MALDWYAPRYSHQIQSLGTANLCLCEEFWCRQSKEMLGQIMKQIFWTVWMDWFWIMFTMKRKLKIYHMLIILTFGSFANPFLLRYFKNIFFIHLLLDGRHDLGKLQHFHQFPRKILQLSLLMSDGESVSRLAAARAKWSPIASFSSQLAANYRSWSIHCYQSDRASRKQLIHRTMPPSTRSLRFHAHTDTFLPHPYSQVEAVSRVGRKRWDKKGSGAAAAGAGRRRRRHLFQTWTISNCLTDWEHGTPLKITDPDFKIFFKIG